MTFILRWPAILVLLAIALLSLLGAAAAGAALGGVDVLPEIQAEAAAAGAAEHTWIDVGLWAAAGLFFLISAVRLMRRTQGFWTWLLGFACYGGRWAWTQQQTDGGVAATVQSIDVNSYTRPAELAANTASPETQIGLLGVILVVGLLVFIVDAADRSYWDKQGA